MIGRGTRLCENLFGEGRNKEEFLIFDFYRNFEYFEMNPEGAKPTKSQSIVSMLFNLRTDIKFALQDGAYQKMHEGSWQAAPTVLGTDASVCLTGH